MPVRLVQPQEERRIIRRSKRVSLIRPCRYEMIEAPVGDRIVLHRGYGISGNVSSNGMLLILPHTPQGRQVLEVEVPSSTNGAEPNLTLVEVRWIRKVDVEPGRHLFLAALTGVPVCGRGQSRVYAALRGSDNPPPDLM